jgi:hypothetical protein
MFLKLALTAFWAFWFAVVFVTNFCSVAKALGWLPEAWRLSSRNYEAVVKATSIYRPPRWVPATLFAGVMLWQLAAAILLACTLAVSLHAGRIDLPVANFAFSTAIALWAAFMIADELTLHYEFERTHELLFIAQLATLLALHLLPD